MARRNRSSNLNNTRVRKISIQNDYAFGIISPVSSTTLPLPVLHKLSRCTSDEIKIPCIVARPWQVESRSSREIDSNDPGIDIGVDPLSDLLTNSPSSFSTSTEKFRRWSFSNLQSAFKATDPSGTEVSSQFTSDDEDFMRTRKNINGSYANILIGKPGIDDNWISDFIISIPDKIRKLSTEKKPTSSDSLTNIYSPSEELRKKLQRVYVY